MYNVKKKKCPRCNGVKNISEFLKPIAVGTMKEMANCHDCRDYLQAYAHDRSSSLKKGKSMTGCLIIPDRVSAGVLAENLGIAVCKKCGAAIKRGIGSYCYNCYTEDNVYQIYGIEQAKVQQKVRMVQ